MSKYKDEFREEVDLKNPVRKWVKPLLVVLSIRSTYNDPATCAAQNKFTGNDETFGPSDPPISCGPNLS